jgi:hypothetical protein
VIDYNQILLLIAEVMARYLTHMLDNAEKSFINRLDNCFIFYNSFIINANIIDEILSKHNYLLSVDNDMIKATIDIQLFDRAGIFLKYIPLVHSILATASGSLTITSIIPCLIYFYCTDKGRECMSRGASMYNPSLMPHNPNMGKTYDDYVYCMGDPTSFNNVLKILKS